MVEEQVEEQAEQKSKMQLAVKDEDWHLVGLPPPGAIKALKIFCKEMLDTPFLPASLIKNAKSDDQLVGILLSVCLTGKEMGLSPMQSLRSFWLSPDGRLGMYADAMMARMLAVGAKLKWIKSDREGAILEAVRGDNSYRAEFTVEDAKAAGLWTKDRSPWPKYPRQLCEARVKGMIFRALFADLGGTSMYSKEELQDMDDEPINITPREEAEREADKVAEADPKLRVQKKTKPPQTVDVKAEEVKDQTPPPAEAPPAEQKRESAEKPKSEKEIFNERKSALLAKVNGATTDMLQLFFLGYLGQPFPKTPEPYYEAMDKLELAVSFEQGAAAFKNAPEDLGKMLKDTPIDSIVPPPEPAELSEDEPWEDEEPQPEAEPEPEPAPAKQKVTEMPKAAAPAATADPLEEKYNWSPETCAMARRVMKARKLDEVKFGRVYSTFGFAALSDDEARMLLLLYFYAAEAMLIKRAADQKKMSVRDLLALVNQHFKGIITPESSPQDAAKAILNAFTEIQTI